MNHIIFGLEASDNYWHTGRINHIIYRLQAAGRLTLMPSVNGLPETISIVYANTRPAGMLCAIKRKAT